MKNTNSNIKFYATIAMIVLVAVVLLWNNKRSPGRVYMPDMTYSQAIETYAASVIPTKVGNGLFNMGARLPVVGSIPRGLLPKDSALLKDEAYVLSYTYKLHFKDTEEDKARAGNVLKNPYKQTEAVLADGKVIYDSKCSVCHGAKGAGDGQIVVLPDGGDGPFKAVPPAYSDKLKTLKDGEIFHSITYGKGMMGGYGTQINPDERWKLICYIKSLGGIVDGAVPTAAPAADSASTKTAVAAK